ncbi:MAG: M20 family metallopeptidase [Desulfobacterales bacterium]|nr:M20 family metallopeptidase [Desulfobacterales bacterium]
MDFEMHPLYGWLSELRRDFHMHPEPSFEEHRTTARIKAILTEMDVELRTIPGLATGAVGVVRGREGGKVLALRADIDALRMEEQNDVPYRSRNAGIMHACGHDGHTAIMLGVARRLKETGLPAGIKGELRFLFQPAEEIVSGAKAMIAAGAMDDPPVDRVLAAHLWPDLPVGQVGFYRDVSHAASDGFYIDVQGRGVHGSSPEKGRDPIVAGAALVQAAQTIVSRNLDPTDVGVISFGEFQAGSAPNVIPPVARLSGTIRSFKPEVRDTLIRRLQELCRGLGEALGVTMAFTLKEGVPACRNDPEVSAAFFDSTASVAGKENLRWLDPKCGGEDFAFMARKAPGAIIRLGCRDVSQRFNHPLHSPHFDMDEAVLPLGVEIFCRAVMDYLG